MKYEKLDNTTQMISLLTHLGSCKCPMGLTTHNNKFMMATESSWFWRLLFTSPSLEHPLVNSSPHDKTESLGSGQHRPGGKPVESKRGADISVNSFALGRRL